MLRRLFGEAKVAQSEQYADHKVEDDIIAAIDGASAADTHSYITNSETEKTIIDELSRDAFQKYTEKPNLSYNSDQLAAEQSDSTLCVKNRQLQKFLTAFKKLWAERSFRYSVYIILGFVLLLIIYIIVAAIYHTKLYREYSPNKYVINYNPALGSGDSPSGVIFAASKAAGLGTEQNPVVVSLAGDSMISFTFEDNNLGGKLMDRISQKTDLKFQFVNNGRGGATIAQIGKVIVPNIIADGASIVILMWDSDATDSNTINLTPAEYQTFKDEYVKNLNYVMGNVTNLPQVKFFAIAGPSIFGEGPLGKPSYITSDKDKVLADLRDINIAVAQQYQVTYIDMNHALHSVSVPWWALYNMWCTLDGEHYNDLGASVEADNFVRFLTY